MIKRIKEYYQDKRLSNKYKRLLKIYDKPKLKDKIMKYSIYLILIIIIMFYNEYCRNELYIIHWNNKADDFNIDLDEFRKFHIGSEYLVQLEQMRKKEQIRYRYTKNPVIGKIIPLKDFSEYEYFTMTMILNKYNSLTYRKINTKYLDKILSEYSRQEEFQLLNSYYMSILTDIREFPINKNSVKKPYYSYVDTWYASRAYGGARKHEGTDFMPFDNTSGKYPIRSITDGMVEQVGWLEQGGYRVGIRSKNGAYFYYAHLDSWIDGLEIDDEVYAGQIIGYMGDTGYGVEGTRGKFVVHLHMGFYVNSPTGEMSINPYYILKYLEDRY